MEHKQYYAHTAPKGVENIKSNWQTLENHLQNVGELTAKFASEFSMENEGRVIGLTHDLGKYSNRFSERLENPDEVTGVNHWTPSSMFLWDENLIRLMLCVEGHHTGLPNLFDIKRDINSIKKNDLYRIEKLGFDEPVKDIIDKFLSKNNINISKLNPDIWKSSNFKQSLKIRMLFSCLIDADRLDTENHFYNKNL